jgi:predicted DCC family thiol-disulfide oxidoreductase YuxK
MIDPAVHPVVLFDGVCNLCHGVVRFAIRRDRAARLRFAPLQSPAGRALLARAGLDPDALDGVVLIDGKGAHQRSAAALCVARSLGGLWRLAGWLLLIPRPLRDAVYDFVANHRYRWFGRRDHCPAPPPTWRDRFLDDWGDVPTSPEPGGHPSSEPPATEVLRKAAERPRSEPQASKVPKPAGGIR